MQMRLHRAGSLWLGILVAMLGTFLCARADAQAPFASFDEPLAPYGAWVEDPYYGRVWRPQRIDAEWRPYMYGRWVYTTDYGWIWVSEEPWGWVVYHYGRWVWSERYGWVWIADEVWGPAWVEWCYGGGYVGWSPMPPDPYWPGPSYYGTYDCSSPRYYSRAVFVAEAYFAGPRVSAHVVPIAMNPVAARATVNVTSYNRLGATIINRSIDPAKLQASTGVAVKAVRVVPADRPVPPGAPGATLKELRIYRPGMQTGSLAPSDPGLTRRLKLDPDPSWSSSVAPPDRPPLLDSPGTSLSPPSLGGIGPPSTGGGGLGVGLGGVRGRLGR